MKISSRTCRLALVVALAGILAQQVAAQDAAESHFQRGYYLQTLKHDPAGAAKAFEQVLADASATVELKADAQIRLAACREDLAAADLAQLLPADALAYVEINQPGAHVGNLIRMLGLMRDPAAAATSPSEKGAAAKPAEGQPHDAALPIVPGFEFPSDFTISPALVRELEKVRGTAAAITSIDQQGIPDGVLVIHPGESDLLRGLAETSIQFVKRADAIEGFKTYQIENEVWMVQTARLFVIARSKDQAVAAVARLKNPAAESLANNKRFAKLAADRKGALAFACVAGDQIAPLMISHGAFSEAMIARSIVDLDKLESLVAVAKTTPDGIELQGKMVMAAGHRNLAYALIRTAPASRRTLASVPAGAAAVGILGLNPADAAPIAPAAKPGEPRYVSAMDLGREVFANIEEVSVFVVPSPNPDARSPIPEVGLVFGVKDPEQSQALWDQLLALPSMFGLPLTSPPSDVTVEGQAGRQFRFPYIPPVVLVAQKDRTFIAGTQGAVAASLRVAAGKQDGVAKDTQLKPLIDALPKHTSKGAVLHVGRVFRLIAPIAGPDMPREMGLTTSVFDNLSLSLVTDEQPTEFAIRAEAKGLPDITKIVRMMAESHSAAPFRARASEPAFTETSRSAPEIERNLGLESRERAAARIEIENHKADVEVKIRQLQQERKAGINAAKKAIESERTKLETEKLQIEREPEDSELRALRNLEAEESPRRSVDSEFPPNPPK